MRHVGFFSKRNDGLLPWDMLWAIGDAAGSCPTAVWEALIVFGEFTLKIG